jgi:ATP-dependent Clp protease ATP-binding subunit ClpB
MKERHQVAELIGSPPGYVGHEGGSRMCKDARQTGGKMVGLLDEAEKAHPVVWETLMRVFDEGKMTDNTGEEADFNNAIFICTSNLAEDVFAAYAGDGEYTDNDAVNSEFSARYEERIPQAVRGRLKQWGGPLIFNPHGKEAQRKIVDLKVQQMQKYNAQRNDRHFALSEAASQWMMTTGFDPQYGGRALTALINGTLANTLADLVANQKFKEGDYITFDVKVADQDKPLKDRVQSVATSITELGEALKNERLPKDLVRQELADGKIALVDRAKERFFLTEGDGKEIYGPFNATAVTTLQVRAMDDEEKSAYLTKKADC